MITSQNNSLQLELMFGLVELNILPSKVMVRLDTKNQLSSLPGSASKVCVVVVVESKFSDRLWHSFRA